MTTNVIQVIVPKENPNDDEVTLVGCGASSGVRVEKGSEIALLETMKTAFQVTAPEGGFIFFRYKEGDKVPVGEVLAYIADVADFRWKEYEAQKAGDKNALTKDEQAISRKAKKLIDEHGIDLHVFSGLKTVKEEQVLEWIAHNKPGCKEAVRTQKNGVTAPFLLQKLSTAKEYEVQCLEAVYRAVIPSKVDKQFVYPPLQSKMNRLLQDGFIVTLGDLFVHAIAHVLKEFPDLNAFYQDGMLCRYQEINIGYAINLDNKGLKVPVLRQTDRLSLQKIAIGIKELSMKCLRDELMPSDLLGGTFTVTDLSSLQVASFTPVLNLNQSAILGIASPDPTGNFLLVTLAFDHRVTDGMLAARFLNALEEHLSDTASE